MFTLISALVAAVAAPSALSTAICDVGQLALKDLPEINHNNRFDAYFSSADPLLMACPKLQSALPAGYPLADRDARARVSVHAPLPDQYTRPAFIYWISIPKISADLRKATVEMGYECTGLCGGSFVAHYVRTSKGWRREGAIKLIMVS